MCHVVPRCFKLKWWPNRFSSLESDVADNAILVRIYNRAPTDVWWQFSRVPCKCALLIPSPHPFLSLPFTLCTIPLWCPHQFEASLYTMCYPGQTPAPLNLPFKRPPPLFLPLSPVTKTHWQSFWPFFCIHDLKKDPLYPQLRENAFDQFVTSPCALSSVVFHLIGFHLAFKQSIKKSE